MNQEYLGSLRHIFSNRENRDLFLELLDNDYESYDLDYLRDKPVPENVKVVLPNVIFGNLGDCAYVFLENLCKEIESDDCVQLMKMMVYMDLF